MSPMSHNFSSLYKPLSPLCSLMLQKSMQAFRLCTGINFMTLLTSQSPCINNSQTPRLLQSNSQQFDDTRTILRRAQNSCVCVIHFFGYLQKGDNYNLMSQVWKSLSMKSNPLKWRRRLAHISELWCLDYRRL